MTEQDVANTIPPVIFQLEGMVKTLLKLNLSHPVLLEVAIKLLEQIILLCVSRLTELRPINKAPNDIWILHS